MKNRSALRALGPILVCSILCGCGGGDGDASYAPYVSPTSTIDPAPYAVSVAESAGTYDPEDVVENNTFDYTVFIDFTENTARLSSGTAQPVTEGGATVLTVDGTGVTVAQTADGIAVDATVAAQVKYVLTGTLAGTFFMESASPYQLCLAGTDIAGSAGPALDLESDQKAFIVSEAGTTNRLADAATSGALNKKAALHGNGPMILSGEGTLAVTGRYKHGIYGKDYIRVRGGTLDVGVSVKNGIQSVNAFILDDGVITVQATGTTPDEESKGIKVDGDDDTAYGQGKGYVVINGGYLTVASVGKAVTASWDIDEDLGDNTSGNPDPHVEINNGVIDVTTTGTPYEYPDGASLSPEGIEGKSRIDVYSGYLTLLTTEDSLNAGGPITINGGYLYCAGGTDAIDANGALTIAGGVVVAVGGRAPEGPFDCDMNTFAITGGTVVGIGGTVSRPTAAACTQNVVVLGSLAGGGVAALVASGGATALAYGIPQAFATLLVSSPAIATGVPYTVYGGGTASSDAVFYGLYLGGAAYANGTPVSGFTASSSVTQLGGQYF